MTTTRNQSSNCKAAAATLGRKGGVQGSEECRW